jgi:hypothetical protein
MITCFCESGIMSICTAREKEQKDCRFYAKSSVANRCMYFHTGTESCDCLQAQRYARNPEPMDALEDSIDAVEVPITPDMEGVSCADCCNFICERLEGIMKTAPHDISDSDLVDIARSCLSFVPMDLDLAKLLEDI